MSQDGQQDTIPHNLAYLDSLHQGETEGDTDVALNNLFGSGPDDLPHPFAQEQDVLGMGKDNPLDPDPSAQDEASENAVRVPEPDSSSIDPALAPDPPVKRKATSRANMLTRGGACEFCKRRKLKCSAETPKCSACVRWNKDCIYGQKKQRSRVKVLEDRLAELEKKLGNEGSSSPLPATQTEQQTSHIQSAVIHPSFEPVNQPHYPSESSHNASNPSGDNFPYSDLGMDLDPSLDLGFNLDLLGKEVEEPDLMTLADAATHGRPEAGGKYPWAGMDSAQIVSAILKSVREEPVPGIGGKIIPFLIQAYSYPRIPQNLLLFETATLLARLAPEASSPLHPSLTLSIIYLVLAFLPPSVFPKPGVADAIASSVLGPAREYSYQAYATSDPRMVDVVAGQVIRAMAMMHTGRLLEAHAEASGAPSMADACGLTKLNVSPSIGVGSMAIDSERHSGLEKYFGSTIIAPQQGVDIGQRQKAFWVMFLLDKCITISQGRPSGYTDENISTPWPSDDGGSTESVRDFLTTVTPTGKVDSVFCSTVKTLTLLYRALRLFAEINDEQAAAKAQHLSRVCNAYLPSLAPVLHRPSGEWGIQQGPANSNLMTLHTTLAVIHARQSIRTVRADDESLSQCITSLKKVGEGIDLARELGDFAFEGYDMVTATVWLVAGRTAYLTAERLKSMGEKEASVANLPGAEQLRSVGNKIMETLRIMGKRMGYASTLLKLLE